MRGYNADIMLRLGRCDLAQPVALEQFLTRCNRASHGRYEIASAGRLLEHGYGAVILLAGIGWIIAAVLGWGGCAVVVAPLVVGLAWVASMGVSDLRILRSVRRTRVGRCAVCNYQIDAAPPPGAIAAIATCPECGEEVIVGRAEDHETAARASVSSVETA